MKYAHKYEPEFSRESFKIIIGWKMSTFMKIFTRKLLPTAN